MAQVKAKFIMYHPAVKKIENAVQTALELTAEALKTEVVMAQVMPFDLGTMQNDSTTVKVDSRKRGRVSIVTSTPYARRLYYHPEYNFRQTNREEKVRVYSDELIRNGTRHRYRTKKIIHKANKNAKGKWFDDWLPGGEHEDFCAKTFAELLRRNGGL